jgi:hypothetical protein
MDLARHEIRQPENNGMALWRYMDLSKFVALLQSKALYFARSDTLGDHFEGSLPVANAKTYRANIREMWRQAFGDTTDEVLAASDKAQSDMRMKMREEMFISCWHGNEGESAATWRLYAQSGDAVAVKTTFAKLKAALPDQAILGLVSYVDYEHHVVPVDSLIAPFMIKRASFAHENEVRAALWLALPELKPETVTIAGVGASCGVDLNELVDAVYVSPTSPAWFADVVAGLCQQYGLATTPRQSALPSPALF